MTIKIGYLGEQLVSQWLQSKSYRILHHSWRCRWGEIDIIAEDNKNSTLVFVEVKTRSSNNWDYDGLEAISLNKQEKVSNSAALFIAANPSYVDFYMRFDVALVKYQRQHPNYKSEISLAELSLANQEDLLMLPNQLSNLILPTIKNGYVLTIVNYLENAFEVS